MRAKSCSFLQCTKSTHNFYRHVVELIIVTVQALGPSAGSSLTVQALGPSAGSSHIVQALGPSTCSSPTVRALGPRAAHIPLIPVNGADCCSSLYSVLGFPLSVNDLCSVWIHHALRSGRLLPALCPDSAPGTPMRGERCPLCVLQTVYGTLLGTWALIVAGNLASAHVAPGVCKSDLPQIPEYYTRSAHGSSCTSQSHSCYIHISQEHFQDLENCSCRDHTDHLPNHLPATITFTCSTLQ